MYTNVQSTDAKIGAYKKVPEILFGSFSNLHIYCPHECSRLTETFAKIGPPLLKWSRRKAFE